MKDEQSILETGIKWRSSALHQVQHNTGAGLVGSAITEPLVTGQALDHRCGVAHATEPAATGDLSQRSCLYNE